MDWIGKTLGRVRIESLLARGGMAEVYLGTHTTLQRKVAVKILRNHYNEELHLLERFEREARAVAGLRHPNIVQVFDFDTVEDQPYLVMEYIPGPPLSKYLKILHERKDRLSLPLVSRLLTQMAGALQYAHKRGVIHRDVKPGNILLTSRSIQIVPGETLPLDLEPVLTDFGLVRFLNAASETTSGLIIGTPAYMSPEQAAGHAIDGRTDVYSLGIVLYEMLNGKVPFEGESTISILLKHVNESPPPIPSLSPVIQRVLDRALAKKPDDRYQEPDELAAAFNAALDNTSDSSTLVALPQVMEVTKAREVLPLEKPTRRSWLPALLGVLLVGLIGGSVLWNQMRPGSTLETPTISPAPLTNTPMLVIPVTFGPTGELHFEDGDAILDRAALTAQVMPAPPAGSHYEVWLVNGDERLELGTLQLDPNGKGTLMFDDPQNRNLLDTYQQVEITVEPNTDSNPNPTSNVAYRYELPQNGMVYLRALMVSFPDKLEGIGLVQGLTRDTNAIEKAAQDMLASSQSGDQAGVREKAEGLMNILVGDQSPDHKDWNADGQITDPGEGYGFLLNGNSLGYIQAVYSYADYAVNAPGASQNMILHGNNVKACSENLARWAPELRQHLANILAATNLPAVTQEIEASSALADEMLNGVDKDENGEIEPILEECGVLLTQEEAYQMADMPLLPANAAALTSALTASLTPTQTSTPFAPISATPTKQPGQNPNPVQPTVAPPNQPAPPTSSQPKATKKPKPTQKPNPNPPPTKKKG